MKGLVTKETKQLYEVFNSLQLQDEFTVKLLSELTFCDDVPDIKKVHSFVGQCIKKGCVEKTGKTEYNPSTNRYIKVYKKVSDSSITKKIADKNIPDDFLYFLNKWNTFSYGRWITCAEFKQITGGDSNLESSFLWQLKKKGLCGFESLNNGNIKYKKLHPLDPSILDEFVVFRTVPVEIKSKKSSTETANNEKNEKTELSLEQLEKNVLHSVKRYKEIIQSLLKENEELKNKLKLAKAKINEIL